jgi:serine/threonine protein kinase
MAPEIFENKSYSIKADVYSFAIVLWEIICRETPYKNLKTPHAIMKWVTIENGRPDTKLIPPGCPDLVH